MQNKTTRDKKLRRHLKLTSMSSLCLGFVSHDNPSTRVDDGWFLDDETIAVQTLDITTGIRKVNFIHFIRIKPDFPFTTFENRRRKALLKLQRD
jgi:hypothetical protein